MSNDWIALIPEDPYFIPDAAKQLTARIRLSEIAPDTDEFRITVSETVTFFDCAGNFERILCPSCRTEIPVRWWHDRMDDDYENGFKLDLYRTPCCNAATTLRELIYEWPQTFGRFALEARNPNIGLLENEQRREMEEILGTKLVVIYQHI